jgi:HNH endonuclease
MKEIIFHLPDTTYERIAAEVGSAHKSPEQWILDRLFPEPNPSAAVAKPHTLLPAALDLLGFQRIEPEKAKRLSALLQTRKSRGLSDDEAHELHALMSEADALEVESLQRLAAAFGRRRLTVAAAESPRDAVARRARYRCEYCGYPDAASSKPLEIDHILPEARGGRTSRDNLALCCRSCNLLS